MAIAAGSFMAGARKTLKSDSMFSVHRRNQTRLCGTFGSGILRLAQEVKRRLKVSIVQILGAKAAGNDVRRLPSFSDGGAEIQNRLCNGCYGL